MTLAKWTPNGVVLTAVLIVGIPAAVGGLTFASSKLITLAAVGLLALVLAVYVGFRHPLWLFWGWAVMLGLLPFGYFPGVHVPLFLPFLAGTIVAAVVHPTSQRGVHPLEIALLALVVASAMSVVVTANGLTDWSVFIRWTMATIVVVALARLSQADLARFGRVFVYAATLNALFGILMVTADPGQKFMRIFHIFDYDRVETARYAIGDEGRSRTLRLGGTWVDPNGAGISIGVALVLSILLLRGKLRAAASSLLAVALVLTLSRAAIFSVLAGIVLVLLFHSMGRRTRQTILGSIVLVAVIAVSTPFIRTRILSSFGSNDFGAADRGKALAAWPHYMSGHWLFGLGWARREFLDGDYSFKFNIVANAPLIAAYRGGMIVGIIFVAVLIIGCVVGYRALRSDSLPAAMFGGVFIGYCLVGLQLDHPIVHIPQLVMVFSVFLAFLIYLDRERVAIATSSPGPCIPANVGSPAVNGRAQQ
ncbi:O-antigen ligase domain-containing protein [Mycobacterium sp. NPDC006124]|uniref:O-antigen ligase domain-containing protein n=1 Tax=Mycobacterium sp. NPDC006124 TaxID=3156729 RepID=UPI0033AB0F3B